MLHCSNRTPRGTLWGVQNSAGRRLRGPKLCGAKIEGKFAPQSFGPLKVCPTEFWCNATCALLSHGDVVSVNKNHIKNFLIFKSHFWATVISEIYTTNITPCPNIANSETTFLLFLFYNISFFIWFNRPTTFANGTKNSRQKNYWHKTHCNFWTNNAIFKSLTFWIYKKMLHTANNRPSCTCMICIQKLSIGSKTVKTFF